MKKYGFLTAILVLFVFIVAVFGIKTHKTQQNTEAPVNTIASSDVLSKEKFYNAVKSTAQMSDEGIEKVKAMDSIVFQALQKESYEASFSQHPAFSLFIKSCEFFISELPADIKDIATYKYNGAYFLLCQYNDAASAQNQFMKLTEIYRNNGANPYSNDNYSLFKTHNLTFVRVNDHLLVSQYTPKTQIFHNEFMNYFDIENSF